MKKVKYLLGLLVVGVGLLFNQSFALNYITVDGVIEGSLTSNTSRSSNYRYIFAFDSHTINGTATPYSRQFGFSVYYDGFTKYNYYPYQRQAGVCPSSYSEFQIRTGRTSNNWYTGTCSRFSTNIYSFENMPQLAYNDHGSYDRNIRVLLGQDDLFGNAFVVVGVPDSSSDNISPIYSMGAGNLTYENYMPVNENYSDYYRFFYKNTGNVSALKTSWSNSNLANLNYNSWEYFYSRGTRTNYGYIVDDGSLYTKYKHFGLFDMGYSYVYGKVAQSATSLSWSELGFRTVGDEVETFLKIYGDMSYSDFQQYSTNGILLVRANQYLSMGNDDGVYLLSKDPTNYSRVLYEHWSCNSDNVKLIFSGGDSYFHCVKLDGGYLTYNGSTEVLPFTDGLTRVSINTLDSDHPLLYDLANGGRGLTKVAGQVIHSTNSCLQINSNRCYGFISNTSVNIKESYLQTNVITDPVLNQEIIKSNCKNYPDFYVNNYSVCSQFSDSPSNIVSYGTGYSSVDFQYLTVCEYSGDTKICYDKLVPANFTGNVYITGGNTYYISDNPELSSLSTTNSSLTYLSGFIDSGGLISGSYFDNFFNWNSDNLFFSCPFPAIDTFSFITKIKIGSFYPFMPINCFMSAFNVGNTVHYFDDFGVFPDSISHSLLIGDSKYHKILFRFFDCLLAFGLFVILSSLYRLLNK